MSDTTQFAAATGAIRRHLVSGELKLPRGIRPSDVIIRHGDFTFQQLSDWRDIVTDSILGATAGVVLDDLDEAINRVTIGLPASRRAELLPVLAHFGIPLNAVHFRDIAAIKDLSAAPRIVTPVPYVGSIADVADSLSGGFEISSAKGTCTLGYVTAPIAGAYYAVANSHCSLDFWSPDTGTFRQPSQWTSPAYSRRIGYEISDPNGISCNLECEDYRYSDAELMLLDDTVRVKQGFIPRLQGGPGTSAGTRNIDTTNPWLTIAGTTGLASGFPVNKTGRTSGWTAGTITNTCVDGEHGSWPTNHKIVCQGEASVYIDDGDSGSPVFWWDGIDGVQLMGIEWGSPCSSMPCSDMLFSPVSGIVADLGNNAGNAQTNITVGAPNISGSLNGGSPMLSWSAVSTANTTATTIYKVFRSVWDASTYSWMQQGQIGQTTSTSYTDYYVPVPVYSYTDSSQPAQCAYTYVVYTVQAYNTGVGNSSTAVYFQGDANGQDPMQIQC